jgi:hypothetical protein
MTKFLAFAIALLGFNNLNAQEFKTQSLALFKDGNAFFIKKGKVATTNKTFLLKGNEIPQATLGSLWFYSNGNPITAITAFTDTLRKDVEIQTSNDYALLYLNKGKKVTIVLEKEKLEGVVENATRQENNIDRYGNPTGLNTVFDIILFKTTDGRFMTLKAHDIKRVEFTEKPITVHKVPYKEPVNIVSINFEKENKTSDLDAMYIQKGLQWNPFYHLPTHTPRRSIE